MKLVIFSFVFLYFSWWFFFLALTYEVTIITGIHLHFIIGETFLSQKKLRFIWYFDLAFPTYLFKDWSLISIGICYVPFVIILKKWLVTVHALIVLCCCPMNLIYLPVSFLLFIPLFSQRSTSGVLLVLINFLIVELWNCPVAYHYFSQKMEAEKMVRFSMRYMQLV
jgi:hypothetical protein